MLEPAVIELGEVSGQPEPESRPGGPRGPRRHRALAAAVAVALLAGLAGAAPAGGPALRATVPMNLGDSMFVRDDRLYVIGPVRGQAGNGDRRVRAYELPAGALLWDAEIPVGVGDLAVQEAVRGVLLTARYDPDGVGEVIAVDADTGAPRWRRPGWLYGGVDAGAGQVLVGRPGDEEDGDLDAIGTLVARTGEPVWTYRPPPAAHVHLTWPVSDRRPTYIVTALPSGRVEVREAVGGALLRAADTGTPYEPAVPEEFRDWVFLFEDLLIVHGPDRQTYTAYGLPELDRRWSATVPGEQFAWYGGYACGTSMCLRTGPHEMRAIDMSTGGTRWTAEWSYVEAAGDLLVAARDDIPFGSPRQLWLVDPDTGRAVRDLGTWTIAGRSPDQDLIVVSQRLAERRTWYGVVDPVARDVDLRGMAEDVVGECHPGPGVVLCRRIDLSIGIWRYR